MLTMDEQTQQFVIRIFSVTVMLIMIAVLGTLSYLVIRDGNNPTVQTAFASLVSLGQWGIGIMGVIIVGKPIASAVSIYFTSKSSASIAQSLPQGGSVTVTPGITSVQQNLPSTGANGTPSSI